MSVGTVNVYLFTSPEPVLVDAGIKSAESWDALQEGLAKHGLTVLDLSRVIITHAHVDHDGQAGTIVANSDADVWISDAGAPWLLEMDERQARRMTYYREDFLPATGLPAAASDIVLEGLQDMAGQRDPCRHNGFALFAGMVFCSWATCRGRCFSHPDTRVCKPASTRRRRGSCFRRICC